MEAHYDHCVSGHSHFLVTEDLFPLMKSWAKETGFSAPDVTWFARNHQLLQLELLRVLNKNGCIAVVDSFPYFYILKELQQLVYRFLGREIEFGAILSLDNVYTGNMNLSGYFPLQFSRAIDIAGKEIGRKERPFSEKLDAQILSFRETLSGFTSKVIIIDDGMWTGGTAKETCELLKKNNFEVKAAVVGINIRRKGVPCCLDLPVHAVQTYDESSRPVLDWVCERDFFPGVPLGGRTVVDDSLPDFFRKNRVTAGAYYIEKPEWLKNWASIDDPDGQFRRFCIGRSIELFEEVERLSGRPVLFRNLTRVPFSLILNEDKEQRVVDLLEEMA